MIAEHLLPPNMSLSITVLYGLSFYSVFAVDSSIYMTVCEHTEMTYLI